jgi:glycine dehydrogenase subunit 2
MSSSNSGPETTTIFEKSAPGRRGVEPPRPTSGLPPLEDCIPAALRRDDPIQLPEVGELDAVRHYTTLSQRNMGIDTNFYPLGSCTMKYNPRINEVVAGLPGFRKTHPLQKDGEIQGWLEVLYRLERILAEVSGLPGVSLQPAAGAHGELCALMMIKAYHDEREPGKREVVLVPDSAHGTNPSSCTIAGFKTREVRSGADGTIDLDDFRAKLGDDVAGMMITNPNTLGIFEPAIAEISAAMHAHGAFLYMDGANMNAILGITRPGDFGVDIMHFNLHKTFSTPHGGGGPGAGPIACVDKLAPYLPVPRVVRDEIEAEGDSVVSYRLSADFPLSIGKVRSFIGNTGILLRALVYAAAHGPADLRRVSEAAVLNANYIRALLEQEFHLPYATSCMHEVVFTARHQKAAGVRALDIAKRLIDLGFHPPTIYFPLVVQEALMIEPTETESVATLDAFCDAMKRIAEESRTDPDILKEAPVGQVVKRLDEVAAVKTPILVCPCEDDAS